MSGILLRSPQKKGGLPRKLRFQNEKDDLFKPTLKKTIIIRQQYPGKIRKQNTQEILQMSKQKISSLTRIFKSSSQEDLPSHFRDSLTSSFNYVNPSFEKNLSRLNLSINSRSFLQSNNGSDTSTIRSIKKSHLEPPQEYFASSHIDRFYPNPSNTLTPNKINFPGDYNYNKHKVLKIAKKAPDWPEIEVQQPTSSGSFTKRVSMFNDFTSSYQNLQYDPPAYVEKKKSDTLNVLWIDRHFSGTLPESREGACIVLLNKKVYLIGGQSRVKHSDVRVLTPETWQWQSFNTQYKPKGRVGHTANQYRSKIVLFGGWADYSERLRMRRCINKVDVLNVREARWQRFNGTGKTPTPRRNHQSVLIGNSLVIFGGIDSNSQSLSSMHLYQLKNQKWYKIKQLGQKPGCKSYSTFNAIYAQSLLENTKITLPDIPLWKYETNFAHQGCFLFGGLDNSFQCSNDLHVLKISNEGFEWSKLTTQGPTPMERYNHTASHIGKYLIIFGGRNDFIFNKTRDSCLSDLHFLDLEKLTWIEIKVNGDIPDGRWGHSALVYGSRLLIYGGINHYRYMPNKMHVLESEPSYVEELLKLKEEQEKTEQEQLVEEDYHSLLRRMKSQDGLQQWNISKMERNRQEKENNPTLCQVKLPKIMWLDQEDNQQFLRKEQLLRIQRPQSLVRQDKLQLMPKNIDIECDDQQQRFQYYKPRIKRLQRQQTLIFTPKSDRKRALSLQQLNDNLQARIERYNGILVKRRLLVNRVNSISGHMRHPSSKRSIVIKKN